MEQYVQDRLLVFVKKMTKYASKGEIVDLSKWSHFFAFDVIGELVSKILLHSINVVAL